MITIYINNYLQRGRFSKVITNARRSCYVKYFKFRHRKFKMHWHNIGIKILDYKIEIQTPLLFFFFIIIWFELNRVLFSFFFARKLIKCGWWNNKYNQALWLQERESRPLQWRKRKSRSWHRFNFAFTVGSMLVAYKYASHFRAFGIKGAPWN